MKKSDVMDDMRKEYDFSNAKKNPYAGKLKKQITINLDERVLAYFKEEAEQSFEKIFEIYNEYKMSGQNKDKGQFIELYDFNKNRIILDSSVICIPDIANK